MFKKEISLLMKCNLIIIDDISRISVVVCGDHGQGVFRFPMKLLFVMKSSMLLIFYAKKTMVRFSRTQ